MPSVMVRRVGQRTRLESEADMTRTARQPHRWLTLGIGGVAALIWTSRALSAIVMDHDPSTKALFACAALVLAGFALGSVTWILAAPRRAKRSAADGGVPVETTAPTALLGVMVIGLGASTILDSSPNVWGWTLLVAASLVGGLNLGVAFMGAVDDVAPSDAPRQRTAAP